jgi:hypothetical protein
MVALGLIPMHGIGGRGDLPVPLWLAVYSAAAAVAVSFFALAAFWSRPHFERAGGRALPMPGRIVDARPVRWLLKVVGLIALGLLLGAAWFGDPSPARNPAPTWLYVWIWVGIIPLSLLFGPVWRLANPFRTLAGLFGRGRARPVPSRLAYWPAVAGLAAFVWLELAFPDASSPRVVAVFVTLYAVLNVAAGAFYGPGWFAVGDTFEVYAELLARLSPWGRHGGRLVLRNPLAGLASTPRATGLVAFVCVLLGSTGFDGISRWSAWTVAAGNLSVPALVLARTLGLLAAVALVLAVYVLAARAAAGLPVRPGALGPAGLPGAFAHSLVPIAIGYAAAHYFSFAVFQGQAGALLAGDPFGRGWDPFGLSGAAIDYGVVGTTSIAAVQIGAIVLGHVLGVLAAHDRAAALFRRRQLRRAQYPMLAAMVAFTAGGIALVAGS